MKPTFLLALATCLSFAALFADGPKDNIPENVRPIPPIGLDVPEDVKMRLEAGLIELGKEITKLKRNQARVGPGCGDLPQGCSVHSAGPTILQKG